MVRSLIPTERLPRTLAQMEREMERLLKRFWEPEDGLFTTRFWPETNVVETDTGFEVTVELPGMKSEDFHVELRGGELWITGEKKEEKEEKGKTYHRVERHFGEFQRVIPLPKSADEDKVEAQYTDGVLKVVVGKTAEATPKRVEVKS